MENIRNIFKSLGVILSEIAKSLRKILGIIVKKIWGKYADLTLSEKIIFLNIIPAFFAVILPVARFHIFGSYFYVNNPYAVYMIGIIVIIFVSSYFNGLIKLLARSLINAYYLFWIIYTALAGGLTKARPYEICAGYYLSIAVPVIFIIGSLFTYYVYKE